MAGEAVFWFLLALPVLLGFSVCIEAPEDLHGRL
ncbi:hypothetical protein E1H18_277 [Caulobacter sp. RHG1]|nr:hypothetical protein [Caulobacter sp. RHG1]